MNSSTFYYPLKMGRIIFLSMEEVMGRNGIEALLRLASLESYIGDYPPARADLGFPFETLSIIQSTLEMAYGPRGGRGLALRIGRSCFKYGLREYGSMLGITEMAFRLLPLPMKLRTGARSFADLFNKHTDQVVSIEERDGSILWNIERCPLCWGRKAEIPVCHLAVGVIQESLYWLSGGKIFNVEEIACLSRGDPACTIVIDKNPLP
jgi:predicted hydrocarbon binding protein